MNETLQTEKNIVKKIASNKNLLSPTAEGLQEYTGAWDIAQVVHLLKRTLFGAKQQDIQYFKTRTLQQSVDELLQPTAAPSTVPLNNYSVGGYTPTPSIWPTGWPAASRPYRSGSPTNGSPR